MVLFIDGRPLPFGRCSIVDQWSSNLLYGVNGFFIKFLLVFVRNACDRGNGAMCGNKLELRLVILGCVLRVELDVSILMLIVVNYNIFISN